jgi:hypothetical protein
MQSEGLNWGREVDGIQCAVRPAKASFITGESIAVEILYRNTADEVRTVCVRADPFWGWMQYQIKDESGRVIMRPPAADGVEKPLNRADFVILRPQETAVCRTHVEAMSLPPARYRITITINTINRINRILYGFDQFCKENNLSVWLGANTTGEGTFTVQPRSSNLAK